MLSTDENRSNQSNYSEDVATKTKVRLQFRASSVVSKKSDVVGQLDGDSANQSGPFH